MESANGIMVTIRCKANISGADFACVKIYLYLTCVPGVGLVTLLHSGNFRPRISSGPRIPEDPISKLRPNLYSSTCSNVPQTITSHPQLSALNHQLPVSPLKEEEEVAFHVQHFT